MKQKNCSLRCVKEEEKSFGERRDEGRGCWVGRLYIRSSGMVGCGGGMSGIGGLCTGMSRLRTPPFFIYGLR